MRVSIPPPSDRKVRKLLRVSVKKQKAIRSAKDKDLRKKIVNKLFQEEIIREIQNRYRRSQLDAHAADTSESTTEPANLTQNETEDWKNNYPQSERFSSIDVCRSSPSKMKTPKRKHRRRSPYEEPLDTKKPGILKSTRRDNPCQRTLFSNPDFGIKSAEPSPNSAEPSPNSAEPSPNSAEPSPTPQECELQKLGMCFFPSLCSFSHGSME
uniref:C3H1-type domain-containing protein n=1 Tax=Caenorhabditis tropicalis TaxID=1561998 RepID=A0A1I7TN65_9PELO